MDLKSTQHTSKSFSNRCLTRCQPRRVRFRAQRPKNSPCKSHKVVLNPRNPTAGLRHDATHQRTVQLSPMASKEVHTSTPISSQLLAPPHSSAKKVVFLLRDPVVDLNNDPQAKRLSKTVRCRSANREGRARRLHSATSHYTVRSIAFLRNHMLHSHSVGWRGLKDNLVSTALNRGKVPPPATCQLLR